MRRDNVLLLGFGFLGRALAECLHAEGSTVHVIESADTVPIAGVIMHSGGLDDAQLIDELLPHCKTVFYLASSTTPGSSALDPVKECEANLSPCLRFLSGAQKYAPLRLVFVSSGGTLYGDPVTTPTPETHLLQPFSYHGAGKVAMEAFIKVFAHNTGSAAVMLRPSNLYGPGQPLKNGFGVIRTMLDHAMQGTSMPIWGDGENVRDFLYIDDMVSACLRLMKYPELTGTFNVGMGQGYTLNQLLAITGKVCNRKITVEYLPAHGHDVRKVVLDSSRFQKATGWQPATLLEEGIRNTWQWLLTNQ